MTFNCENAAGVPVAIRIVRSRFYSDATKALDRSNRKINASKRTFDPPHHPKFTELTTGPALNLIRQATNAWLVLLNSGSNWARDAISSHFLLLTEMNENKISSTGAVTNPGLLFIRSHCLLPPSTHKISDWNRAFLAIVVADCASFITKRPSSDGRSTRTRQGYYLLQPIDNPSPTLRAHLHGQLLL